MRRTPSGRSGDTGLSPGRGVAAWAMEWIVKWGNESSEWGGIDNRYRQRVSRRFRQNMRVADHLALASLESCPFGGPCLAVEDGISSRSERANLL